MAGLFSGYAVRDVTPAFGALDALGITLAFVAAVTFRFITIPKLAEVVDEGAVTASDFSILVQNLPRRVEVQLLLHEDLSRFLQVNMRSAAFSRSTRVAHTATNSTY